MNKFLIGFVVVVLAGLGVFYVMTKKSGTAGNTWSGSASQLLTSGKAQKCTFSDSGVQGVVYVANSKVRSDYESEQNGKSVKSHSIMDGNTNYVWVEGQDKGFKITAQSSTQIPGMGSTGPGIDMEKKMNYSCSSWSADSSKFVPPGSVQFMDLSSLGR
ncbi:MAG: hypothetical protein HY336_01860 [Candidatus Doudnabacteria bacterium]|nr:hypothetical protein [Candidatus Doudnabacteria bacterium]